MLLPAEKVRDATLHADQDVRDEAVYYFANSHSSDPTLMPLVIQAIEKHGFENAFSSYSFLEEIVQTDETVRWLIQQLDRLEPPTNAKEADPILAYISALTHADPTVLKNHESEIMALENLDPLSRDAISEQISFPSRPPEELWDDLKTSARPRKRWAQFPMRTLISLVGS